MLRMVQVYFLPLASRWISILLRFFSPNLSNERDHKGKDGEI